MDMNSASKENNFYTIPFKTFNRKRFLFLDFGTTWLLKIYAFWDWLDILGSVDQSLEV